MRIALRFGAVVMVGDADELSDILSWARCHCKDVVDTLRSDGRDYLRAPHTATIESYAAAREQLDAAIAVLDDPNVKRHDLEIILPAREAAT